MQFIILIVIYVIFSFVWYVPLFRKQGMDEKVPKKYYVQGFLWGLIPSFLVAVIVEGRLSWLWQVLGIGENSVLYHVLTAFVTYALCEELSKYLFARIAFRKLSSLRKIDIILLFGIVGMGFELFEGLFCIAGSGIIAVIIRCIIALHIMCQFFMGYYYYDAFTCKQNGDKKGYRRNMTIALLVPIFVHGFHDLGGEFIGYVSGGKQDTLAIVSVIIFIACFITDVIFIIFTMKNAYKCALKSRSAEIL